MAQRLSVAFECTPVREAHVGEGGQKPAEAVIEVVADVEEIDALELPPLADTIDPDVINKFVASCDSDTQSGAGLCFTYSGWHVFVRSDGTIIIGDPSEQTTPTPLF